MQIGRKEEIKERLAGLGTDHKCGYEPQEAIERLIQLENALLEGIYEKNHAENMRPQDLLTHFSALVHEFGLENTDTYQRFSANMKDLGTEVRRLIIGQKGERIARNSLVSLTNGGYVKVLFNVVLSNEYYKTEYDAIVLAPYGLFVVEVKTWRGDLELTSDGILKKTGSDTAYNLAKRMSIKELLLREHFGKLFPENYHGVLLIPEGAKFDDLYQKYLVGYGTNAANCIRRCKGGGRWSTMDEINQMVEILQNRGEEFHSRITVRCDQIIEDYAELMAQMEHASRKDKIKTIEASLQAPVEQDERDLYSAKGTDQMNESKGVIDKLAVSAIVGITAGVVIGGGRQLWKMWKRRR